jgi:hypothetical protein
VKEKTVICNTSVGLEHFPVKWTPVYVAKMRPNKEIEPRSDSIGTEKALGAIAMLLALAFASTNAAHAKPKEIVVVGSKINEQKRHFAGIVNRASAGAKLPSTAAARPLGSR